MNKKQPTRGLFDEYHVLDKLSKLKDPLEKLSSKIDFEMFRPLLESIYGNTDRKSNAGAKPYDYIMMFKVLILQRLYNMSDEQTEFQINDRLTFRRFLNLELGHRVPDTNTIWNFREKLKTDNNEKKLFDCFYKKLSESGLVIGEGKLVDASFHEAPRQRNTREENAQVKQGEVPDNWKENPHKLSHKDIDADWVKKNNETFYGYKNHIKADERSKLIDDYAVTSASVHDSQTLEELLTTEDKGQDLHADSAYTGPNQEATINKVGMNNQVHEKGYRNKPLTAEQRESNRKKSKKRARVEHIFGFIENSMNGTYIRTIGKHRAKVIIGLTNLVYNIFRSIQLGLNMLKGEVCPIVK